MPDDEVTPIVVVGQRRRRNTDSFPSRDENPLPSPPPPGNTEEPPEETGVVDPCAEPETQREWDADAAAAAAVAEFKRQSAAMGETLYDREWGASILQRPDGSVTFGPIAHGEDTFADPGEDGVANVIIDLNSIPPGWRLIGAIHTHGGGGHVPSGLNHNQGDQLGLTTIRNWLTANGHDPNLARIYIAAYTTGPVGHQPYVKLTVYNHVNRDSAMAGVEGPEVNPQGNPCSAP